MKEIEDQWPIDSQTMKKTDVIELLSKISSMQITDEMYNDNFNNGRNPLETVTKEEMIDSSN